MHNVVGVNKQAYSLKNNSFTKTPKTIGCKAPFKFRDVLEEKRYAYIRKFFDRSHYETTLMICLA